ncbi:MAG: leucine-rich repeat domain-containing protein, partial [Erysipelotrichaceae bacterium]|nr:leucine-rich repeat domain-containing protein [Erysipelotrichaceae bacterium]
EEKKEKKLKEELFSSPDAVSTLKKIWGYKKQNDGTLELSSYKGEAREVEVPSSIGNDIVSVIGDECFSVYKRQAKNQAIRSEITKITIPEGIMKIGEYAFTGCVNLREVKLPESLKQIGERAFSGCVSLESITLPDNIQTLRRETFIRCKALKDVKLPSKLKTIDEWSFSECISLEQIDIPGSVRTIKGLAFLNCKNLTVIRFSAKPKVMEESAFYGCESLKSIEMPEGADISDIRLGKLNDIIKTEKKNK